MNDTPEKEDASADSTKTQIFTTEWNTWEKDVTSADFTGAALF